MRAFGDKEWKVKVVVLSILVIFISALHYLTRQNQPYHHIFYRELYFLPIILSGLWFGLQGTILTTILIFLFYTPFVLKNWRGFSSSDFDRVMEVILYFTVAILVGILVDREKKNQERLREIERHASMGIALSAVAHDLKTPLVAIGGFASSVQRNLSEKDPNYQKLGIVIEEVARLENMVQEMLDFSQPLKLSLELDDPIEVVKSSRMLVEPEARKKNVRITISVEKDVCPIFIDSKRLKQAIINLLMNAIQASETGESIEISIRQNSRQVYIDIADEGCGLSTGEEIFVPFYTTKEEGTGLGLAIVKKIIRAHRGSIKVLKNRPQGVIFRLCLPRRLHGTSKS